MKAALVLLLACGAAQAEFLSGNDLLSRIESDSIYLQGMAMGYIVGSTDATYRVWHCTPSTATAGQVQDVVRKYLRENPSVRHFSADSNVAVALSLVWPCPKKGGGT